MRWIFIYHYSRVFRARVSCICVAWGNVSVQKRSTLLECSPFGVNFKIKFLYVHITVIVPGLLDVVDLLEGRRILRVVLHLHPFLEGRIETWPPTVDVVPYISFDKMLVLHSASWRTDDACRCRGFARNVRALPLLACSALRRAHCYVGRERVVRIPRHLLVVCAPQACRRTRCCALVVVNLAR